MGGGVTLREAADSKECRRGFGAAAAGPLRTQPRSLGCGSAALYYNPAKSSRAAKILRRTDGPPQPRHFPFPCPKFPCPTRRCARAAPAYAANQITRIPPRPQRVGRVPIVGICGAPFPRRPRRARPPPLSSPFPPRPIRENVRAARSAALPRFGRDALCASVTFPRRPRRARPPPSSSPFPRHPIREMIAPLQGGPSVQVRRHWDVQTLKRPERRAPGGARQSPAGCCFSRPRGEPVGMKPRGGSTTVVRCCAARTLDARAHPATPAGGCAPQATELGSG